MENELYHHGVKGMRWGIRRYQNSDGSLTELGKKKLLKSDGTLNRKGERKLGKDYQVETDEQRREKALKSSDAKVVYKNRDMLTTSELKERIDRINTETNLAKLTANDKKTGMDKVDSIIKAGIKLDQLYQLTNTPLGKTIKKQLGIDKVEEEFNLEKTWADRNKLSTNKLQEVSNRMIFEANIKKSYDKMKAEEKAAKDAENKAKLNEKIEKAEKKAYKDLLKNPKFQTEKTNKNFQEFKSVYDSSFSKDHTFTFGGDDSGKSSRKKEKVERVNAEVVSDAEWEEIQKRRKSSKNYANNFSSTSYSSFTSNAKRISDGETFALGFHNSDPRRWNI